ncbi:DUF2953 domain-containing protein [Paenibacillus melissococcoides]|uniref:DUF2953 domain-containing protein n=1 Tax=Paenibacillus melissococcoides TaxID=2912268 RepID=A0ABM9G1Z3_9BACL|nr:MULTISPECIES: DUF2953 domain-containing protein [Paenibacillus]MEB9895579.1 DUF2953 domain-containing protein [Bacillus cereus]CAH8245610.1 DUF2953 domain-containing protein [Paenibacillus melissococcoides]CAH8711460.1 DUF2953 domain-containing protein [Paenibacillus melissococcoides]CAH8712224.1 DUF2953 domain-containing protein [Paenibacillus melissococcoides]GIO76946.1 hypothetical protein J6TS7_05560 [Paenibacillus dendritiformis]
MGMWIMAGVAAVIAMLLFLILFSTVECKLVIHKVEKHERVSLIIRAFYGWIRWRYEWRSIRFINMEEGINLKQKKKKENFGGGSQDKTKRNVNRESVARYAKRIKRLVRHTRGIVEWVEETMDHMKCWLFIWETELGVGDPAGTAIAAGTTWSLKSWLVGKLSYSLRFQDYPRLGITPQFHYPYFSTRIVCIAEIRVGHVIRSVIRLAFRIVRAEGGIGMWRRTLAEANARKVQG